LLSRLCKPLAIIRKELIQIKRIMAVDYGRSRVGIAVSDPLGITARGIETIDRRTANFGAVMDRIKLLCKEFDVETVIVGLPRRTDGKESESEDSARYMASQIEINVDDKVIMRDERYTTVIANRIMRETGVKQSKKKGMVDQIAAEILLQDYLNHCIK